MSITATAIKPAILRGNKFLADKALYLSVVASIILAANPVFAQTPVAITVDTNEIFTQTNNWIDVFLPIVAIGAGISIAIAILTFIVKQIVAAF